MHRLLTIFAQMPILHHHLNILLLWTVKNGFSLIFHFLRFSGQEEYRNLQDTNE